MSSTPTVTVVQAVGLTASAALAGSVLAGSFLAMPSILLAPNALAAKQWRKLYLRGAATAPPFTIAVTLSFAYLAYVFNDTRLRAGGPKCQYYVGAALATLSIIPYTLVLMKETNSKLILKAAEADKVDVKDDIAHAGVAKNDDTRELMNNWISFNTFRCIFPLTACALGTVAAAV
ncbi:hypothetical protein MMC19_005605 [Ptychographa xylographoides]|nr:hypothetical protein [Ptychographa xylographoides]